MTQICFNFIQEAYLWKKSEIKTVLISLIKIKCEKSVLILIFVLIFRAILDNAAIYPGCLALPCRSQLLHAVSLA